MCQDALEEEDPGVLQDDHTAAGVAATTDEQEVVLSDVGRAARVDANIDDG